ncbi:bifunctional diaminohydroxyphosphoribosylaminopyrimidine deaminase/5-amino-6-(5-phosphoribosylamino)uracil reductase RibD [Psittacicella hinzii]|uniref:Riboflavin biosynthesis protein RibD n=1 Tax=Psittacicella hinzii TaxID=2028575 RepID=A0A3A1YRM0_9GAMM|nr:bifunctional diaminohydroxyphosphoribosylaminopyrimidine deaminase/5-amino-6-(5-phosphoribosylamino)uracil reductase RibD [Psittacicella hinzii]RIY39838.1 riboflavin biosynthesis protein RibD [Psittacicella hinzii]
MSNDLQQTDLSVLETTTLPYKQVAFSELDQFAQYCIELAYQQALKGKISCYPNPAVGCVITKDQQILVTGYHHFAGTAHAERDAVQRLQQQYPDTWQELLAGATAYVTLEPCAHYGRTPPCAQLLVDCKLAKVIYTCQDTTPKVNGKGAQMLAQASIEVIYTPYAPSAKLNQDFFALNQQTTDLPFVRLKIGASLDSRIALPNKASKWITSPQSRAYVQALRWQANAVLCSAQTVIVDQARYNVRYSELPAAVTDFLTQENLIQPALVVIDNQHQLTGAEAIFSSLVNLDSAQENNLQRDIYIVSKNPHPLAVKYNSVPQLKFINDLDIHAPQGLANLLVKLKQHGLEHILVETGAQLTNAFIQAGLFDQLHYFMSGKVLGAGLNAFSFTSHASEISQVLELKLLYQQMLGEQDLYLVYQNTQKYEI